MTQRWSQSVIVENRTGANGNIAMTAVAKAPPDGYTVALVPVGNAAVNPSLFPDLPYDLTQFAPITQIANVENVLVVSAKSDLKTVADLIALGKSKDLTYATPGARSIAHLAAELFARSAGFRVTHVTYRGVTPALTDVLRGEVTMMFSQVSTAKPLIDSGQLRPRGREREAQPRASRCADDRRKRNAGLRGSLLVCADGAGRNARRDHRQAARWHDRGDQCAGG